MDILALFFVLQIKHYWADFVIQTYQQTIRKGIYRDLCGISHSLDHLWCSLLALLVFSFFYPISILNIIFVSAVEVVLHYHIDFFKVKYGTKDQTQSLFWNQFGMDQLAHQITYIAMAGYLLL